MQVNSKFDLDDEVTVKLVKDEVDGVISGVFVDHGGVQVRVEYFDMEQSRRSEWFREGQVEKRDEQET